MGTTETIESVEDSARKHLGREWAVGIGLAIALLVLIIWSMTIGPYDLTMSDAIASILQTFGIGDGPSVAKSSTVLLVIRLPRILLAALVGAALAVSGAAYQGLFKNPMVSPDILGVSSGAGVGAALGILLGMPTLGVHLLSFAVGIAAVTLVMAIAKAVGKSGNTLVIMILAGTVISSVFSALTSLIKYVADPDDKLPAITYWLMGSFARSGVQQSVIIMAVILLVAGGVMVLMRWQINVMAFGEEEARTMGVNVPRTRTIIILASTLLTSASVCLCGTIGWVGLIIPHITRLATGPNYRSLLPISMLGGACFMVLVDDVARCLNELPVGILTALIGAPLFIYMLVKGRREWL
jgi:iron complex transport system permease protein